MQLACHYADMHYEAQCTSYYIIQPRLAYFTKVVFGIMYPALSVLKEKHLMQCSYPYINTNKRIMTWNTGIDSGTLWILCKRCACTDNAIIHVKPECHVSVMSCEKEEAAKTV